jgi:hypothetical protein
MLRLVLMFDKTLLFICFHFLLALPAFAQKQPVPLKIGMGLSSFSYTGDLIESGDQFRRFYPGGNFSLQFVGKRAFQMQANVGFGSFAEQADLNLWPGTLEVVPNNFVETSIFYADLRLKYWFFKRRALRPFIGAGLGMLRFNPKDEDGNFLDENIFTRLEGEDYNSTVANFPVSTGLEMRISPLISLGLEYIYRFTPTDYLDNIGQLGPVEGNDGLHAIQINMFFTLNPRVEPTLPPVEESIPAPYLTVEEVGVSTAGPIEVVPLYLIKKNPGKSIESKKSNQPRNKKMKSGRSN